MSVSVSTIGVFVPYLPRDSQQVPGGRIHRSAVLSVPDGYSVTTLMNAAPIRSEGGEGVSVVVTLQDGLMAAGGT